MKFVCITYTRKPQYKEPLAWLHRVRAYTGLLEALAQKHSVVSIDRIDYTGSLTVNNVLHIFPDAGTSRLSAAWRINRFARDLQPDIVLVQGMIFPLQVILLRLQLGGKVKIIVQNHSEKAGTGRRRLLQQLADPVVDAYLFVAKEQGDEWLREHIIRNAGKIRQVMEASSLFTPGDSAAARIRLGISGNPVFVWVGRLDTNKDPLTVIRAFLEFASASAAPLTSAASSSTATPSAASPATATPAPRLYLLFHTRELLPSIEALLDSTPNGREKIILIGEKTHLEMEDWYRAADYIISGSHYEGGGIAVCEAMSCGCIPILTDILSFRMMTGNGACGILYPPGDPDALRKALEEVTRRNPAAEKQKVLTQFQKKLSFEAIANTIHDIAISI